MLSDTLSAVFTAAIVALLFLFANIYTIQIAKFFATPIPGVPHHAFDKPANHSNPLGEVFKSVLGVHLVVLTNPLPQPTHSVGPIFPLPTQFESSTNPPTTKMTISSHLTTSTTPASSSRPTPINTKSKKPAPITDPTDSIPHSAGIDEYHLYTGNGSIAAGWPHKADWISFSEMYLPHPTIHSPEASVQLTRPLPFFNQVPNQHPPHHPLLHHLPSSSSSPPPPTQTHASSSPSSSKNPTAASASPHPSTPSATRVSCNPTTAPPPATRMPPPSIPAPTPPSKK
ncbi:MAG: hypothetical protein Q9171_007357 [Xanthocarpia ochracea]